MISYGNEYLDTPIFGIVGPFPVSIHKKYLEWADKASSDYSAGYMDSLAY